jgi:cell division initiation protein
MAIKPSDIDSIAFSPAARGYSTGEVDAFLEQLSEELSVIYRKNNELAARLIASQAQVKQLNKKIAELEQECREARSYDPSNPSSDQISQILIVAQQSADQIVSEAQQTAEKIRDEGDKKAREVIAQVLAESESELREVDRLKKSRSEFRDNYLRMVDYFAREAAAVMPTDESDFAIVPE